jgi:predicted RNA binding protein YcfA (HicA-like mRNA interferase family)
MHRLEEWVRHPHNVRFIDLCREAKRLGFVGSVRGSHHTYRHPILHEKITLTRGASGKAHPYQIRQLHGLAVRYGLPLPEEDP